MRMSPTMTDAVFLDGSLWFSAREFNGLCRCDVKRNIVNCVDCFPGEDASLKNSHRRCFLVEKQIFFLPCSAKQIHIFDVQKGKFTVKPFCESVTDACLIGNTIYIFCLTQGNHLYEFDTKTKEICPIKEFTLQLDKISKIQGGNQVLRCYAEENHIWFGVGKTRLVGCWDVNLRKLDIIDTGVEDIFCARRFEEDLWIVDGCTSSIFCLEKFKKLRKYDIPLEIYKTVNSRFRCFNNIFEYEGNLIFVPGFSNTVVVWDQNDMNLFALPMTLKCLELPLCLRTVKTDREILILPFESESFICVGGDGVVELRDPMKLSERYLKDLSCIMLRGKEVVRESKYVSLEGFLDYIKAEC